MSRIGGWHQVDIWLLVECRQQICVQQLNTESTVTGGRMLCDDCCLTRMPWSSLGTVALCSTVACTWGALSLLADTAQSAGAPETRVVLSQALAAGLAIFEGSGGILGRDHVFPPTATLIVAPSECHYHRTCPEPITRAGPECPPENVNRLKVLTNRGKSICWHSALTHIQCCMYFAVSICHGAGC